MRLSNYQQVYICLEPTLDRLYLGETFSVFSNETHMRESWLGTFDSSFNLRLTERHLTSDVVKMKQHQCEYELKDCSKRTQKRTSLMKNGYLQFASNVQSNHESNSDAFKTTIKLRLARNLHSTKTECTSIKQIGKCNA